jgi:hypothetical protein
MTGAENPPTARSVFSASVMLTGGAASPARSPAPPAGLDAVEEALASGDAAAMLRAWHNACLEALGSQRWEPMVAVGEAAWRIGQATGFKIAFAAKARQAYHVALYRAHKQGTVDGVRRVGEAFEMLGDREAVEQCASIAERLGEGR